MKSSNTTSEAFPNTKAVAKSFPMITEQKPEQKLGRVSDAPEDSRLDLCGSIFHGRDK